MHTDIESIKDYDVYKKHVEDFHYESQNREMNRDEPLFNELKEGGWIATIRFQSLFERASKLSIMRRDGYLRKPLVEIINQIRALKTLEGFEDSRCYPTGLAMKENLMIVGEAPGKKGRAVDAKFLKPSFVFTRTSWILRRALMSVCKVPPYITNLCKYAAPNNKIHPFDFDYCRDIFLQEVKLLKPSKIIFLGHNAYDHGRTSLIHFLKDNIETTYVPHPAFAWRKNWTNEEYVKLFQRVLSV